MKQLQNILEKKLADGDINFEYKDFRIEIDEDNEVVRVIKGNNMVRFWYTKDSLSTAKLPKSVDYINEYYNIFDKNK